MKIDAVMTYKIISGNTQNGSFHLDSNTGILSLRETVSFLQTPDQNGRSVSHFLQKLDPNWLSVSRSYKPTQFDLNFKLCVKMIAWGKIFLCLISLSGKMLFLWVSNEKVQKIYILGHVETCFLTLVPLVLHNLVWPCSWH